MRDSVVTTEALTVYRETYAAIRDVSFTLAAGPDTAIVGPNGAGKSTLVQALLGILPHQAGHVSILGRSLTRAGQLDPQVCQQIAYLPQSFLVDRRVPMTVEEVVGLGWDPLGLRFPWVGRRSRRQAVRQALTCVEAWDLRRQMISSLSGGQTKRVLLAYCLVAPAAADFRRGSSGSRHAG